MASHVRPLTTRPVVDRVVQSAVGMDAIPAANGAPPAAESAPAVDSTLASGGSTVTEASAANPAVVEESAAHRGKESAASPTETDAHGSPRSAMDDDVSEGAEAEEGNGAGAAVGSEDDEQETAAGSGRDGSALFRGPLEYCWLARDCTVCHKFMPRAREIRVHPIVPGEQRDEHISLPIVR